MQGLLCSRSQQLTIQTGHSLFCHLLRLPVDPFGHIGRRFCHQQDAVPVDSLNHGERPHAAIAGSGNHDSQFLWQTACKCEQTLGISRLQSSRALCADGEATIVPLSSWHQPAEITQVCCSSDAQMQPAFVIMVSKRSVSQEYVLWRSCEASLHLSCCSVLCTHTTEEVRVRPSQSTPSAQRTDRAHSHPGWILQLQHRLPHSQRRSPCHRRHPCNTQPDSAQETLGPELQQHARRWLCLVTTCPSPVTATHRLPRWRSYCTGACR